jgi:hypothetical protein
MAKSISHAHYCLRQVAGCYRLGACAASNPSNFVRENLTCDRRLLETKLLK